MTNEIEQRFLVGQLEEQSSNRGFSFSVWQEFSLERQKDFLQRQLSPQLFAEYGRLSMESSQKERSDFEERVKDYLLRKLAHLSVGFAFADIDLYQKLINLDEEIQKRYTSSSGIIKK